MKRLLEIGAVVIVIAILIAMLWPLRHWILPPVAHKVSPLHRAAFDGDNAKIKELLRSGMNVDIRDDIDDVAQQRGLMLHKPDGGTPLHRAARAGRLGAARILLEHGASVNATDYLGRTPLHWAAEHREQFSDSHYLEVIRLLITKGAKVNIQDNYGDTPLHLAAEAGQTEIVKILLENGADTLIRDHVNRTPLDRAAQEPTLRSLLRTYTEKQMHKNNQEKTTDQ